MALTLHVTSYKNHPPVKKLSVTINEAGCTIGRAANNNFVLPDVERIISHHHATIQYENGSYYLVDNSTNGAFINHAPEPIGQGNRVPLHDGDILSIGEYDCAISITMQQKQAAPSLLDNALLKPPVHSEVQEKKPALLIDTPPKPEIPIPPASSEGPGPAAEQDYFRPPEPIPPAEAIKDDWDDLLTGIHLGKKPEPPPLIPEPEIEPEPAPVAAPPQPASHEEHLVKPEVKAQRTAQVSTNLNQQAVDAFLAGACLTQVKLEPEAIISFMTTAGQLMREITQGFRQVLDTRTSLKGEFRLGMTVIRPAENNPLKFSIDVEDALTKLLLPPPKGYLPAIDAIQEATDDLQAHQMALLAGLRAALSSLVAHFDPEVLEKDFQKVSIVDNLLPSIRKAKQWEAFKSRYRKAAADAENDFLHFLGDEFTIAYEQQIQRLKNARQKK